MEKRHHYILPTCFISLSIIPQMPAPELANSTGLQIPACTSYHGNDQTMREVNSDQ